MKISALCHRIVTVYQGFRDLHLIFETEGEGVMHLHNTANPYANYTVS
jgi:hypothetical protein